MAGLVAVLCHSSIWLVYQTVGLAPTNFFRNLGLACALYIDELFTPVGFWCRPISQRDQEFSFQAAEATLFIVSKVLVHLRYFHFLA